MASVRVGQIDLKVNTKEVDAANKKLDGMANQVPGIGRAFELIKNPITLAVGAITTAAGATLKLVNAADEFQRSQARVNALLRTTEQASGLTARSLEDMAQRLANSSTIAIEEIRLAQAQLLTFKAIGTDTFERVLKVSQDLSALGFGSLTSQVVRLGKALQDPQIGLSALREIGISFTNAQREMIIQLDKAGDSAAAMGETLKVIEEQSGGAAEALNTGLTAATDKLGKAWDNMIIRLGNTEPFESAGGALEGLTKAVTDLFDSVAKEDTFEELQKQAQDLQAAIADMGPIDRLMGLDDAAKARLEDIRLRLERIAILANDQNAGEAYAQMSAKMNEAHAAADKLATRQKELYDKYLKFSEGQAAAQDRERMAASKRAQAIIKDDIQRGISIRDNVLTPQEKYNKQIEELDGLLDRGRISQETYTRATEKYNKELEDATKETGFLGLATRDWQQLGVNTFARLVRGGASFQEILKSLAEDILLMSARMLIFGENAKGAFGGAQSAASGFSGFFSSIGSFFGSSGGAGVSEGAAQAIGSISVAAAAEGLSGTFGGKAGRDQNVVSLNGTPFAKVSAGEQFSISPNRGGGMGGGVVFNQVNNITVESTGDKDDEKQAEIIATTIEKRQQAFVRGELVNQQRSGNILNPTPIRGTFG